MEFQAHMKANQKLKYLNKGGTQMNATLNVIMRRIFNLLTRLTSTAKKNAQIRIDRKYQGHANDLTKTGLALKTFLSLK